MQLHQLRAHGHGTRNLLWGVISLFLSIAFLSVALFLSGAKALLALGVCLLTFTVLFVLARLHVFRQRNGGFLALGLVCFFAALVPLVEKAYAALGDFIRNRPAPAVVTASAPAPATSEVAPEPPRLVTAFGLTAADPAMTQLARITKDSRIALGGATYLLKTGDLIPVSAVNGNEVTLAARDQMFVIGANSVEMLPAPTKTAAAPSTPPSLEAAANETPTQITARSQKEAIRRYPALGIKGSLENEMFVNLYREILSNGGEEFFTNPEWPVELAEMLAKREGWKHGAPPKRVSDGTFNTVAPEDAERSRAAASDAESEAAQDAATVEQPDQSEPQQ